MLEVEKGGILLIWWIENEERLGDRLGLGVFLSGMVKQTNRISCLCYLGALYVLEILLGGCGEKKVLVMWIIVFLELMHD